MGPEPSRADVPRDRWGQRCCSPLTKSVQLLASPWPVRGHGQPLCSAHPCCFGCSHPLPEPLVTIYEPWASRLRHPWRLLFLLLLVLVLAAAAALGLKGGPGGLGVETSTTLHLMLPWRWPRVLEALSAGALLAGAEPPAQTLDRQSFWPVPRFWVSRTAAGSRSHSAHACRAGCRHEPASVGGRRRCVRSARGLLFFARAAAATAQRMLLVGVAIGTVFSALVTALAASGRSSSRWPALLDGGIHPRCDAAGGRGDGGGGPMCPGSGAARCNAGSPFCRSVRPLRSNWPTPRARAIVPSAAGCRHDIRGHARRRPLLLCWADGAAHGSDARPQHPLAQVSGSDADRRGHHDLCRLRWAASSSSPTNCRRA